MKKRNSGYICMLTGAALLVGIGGVACSSEEAGDYHSVILYNSEGNPVENPLEIRLVLHPEPIHFLHRKPINEGTAIESNPWWTVYKASFTPLAESYLEWLTFFTENYREQAQLSEEDFSVTSSVPIEKRSLEESSLLYELYVQSETDTICYAVFANGLAKQFAGDLKLDNGVLVRIFRKTQGEWKVETIPTGLWTDRLPFSDLSKFLSGLQEGALIEQAGSYPKNIDK